MANPLHNRHQLHASGDVQTRTDLHVCPNCASELVYPTSWDERQDGLGWDIWLRCPNCEWRTLDSFAQDAVDRFDHVLDRGFRSVHRDLRKLMRENMGADVDKLIQALWADALLPEDF